MAGTDIRFRHAGRVGGGGFWVVYICDTLGSGKIVTCSSDSRIVIPQGIRAYSILAGSKRSYDSTYCYVGNLGVVSRWERVTYTLFAHTHTHTDARPRAYRRRPGTSAARGG
jgi:hypothetical protein